jgi:hypothetical protein
MSKPAGTKAEWEMRLHNLKRGDWICPCGATVYSPGGVKSMTDWCPYCDNVQGRVAWLAKSHEATGKIIRNKTPENMVQCAGCGILFAPKRNDAKYHSKACKQADYRRRKK